MTPQFSKDSGIPSLVSRPDIREERAWYTVHRPYIREERSWYTLLEHMPGTPEIVGYWILSYMVS